MKKLVIVYFSLILSIFINFILIVSYVVWSHNTNKPGAIVYTGVAVHDALIDVYKYQQSKQPAALEQAGFKLLEAGGQLEGYAGKTATSSANIIGHILVSLGTDLVSKKNVSTAQNDLITIGRFLPNNVASLKSMEASKGQFDKALNDAIKDLPAPGTTSAY